MNAATVGALLILAAVPNAPAAASDVRPEVDPDIRLTHARELLGQGYAHSVVRAGERVSDIYSFVFHSTAQALPASYHKQAETITRTILFESQKYGFDPIFVMAVIKHESRFVPTMRGAYGEIGLMQLKPSTAAWIAHKYKMNWKGASSLNDPSTNIRLGCAYLSYLRERFSSHGRLYLSAYNMGYSNVKRALRSQIKPKDYVVKVMREYIKFYSTLDVATSSMKSRQLASASHLQ